MRVVRCLPDCWARSVYWRRRHHPGCADPPLRLWCPRETAAAACNNTQKRNQWMSTVSGTIITHVQRALFDQNVAIENRCAFMWVWLLLCSWGKMTKFFCPKVAMASCASACCMWEITVRSRRIMGLDTLLTHCKHFLRWRHLQTSLPVLSR